MASTHAEERTATAKKDNAEKGEIELDVIAEERLRELRSDTSLLVEIMKARPADTSVRLPMAPLDLHPTHGGMTQFKKGNNVNQGSHSGMGVGEYRQAIRDALEANPQLWVKLYGRMTPNQREFMVVLSESPTLTACINKIAERTGVKRETIYNRWRSWPETICEAVIYGSKALYDEPVSAATAIKKAYLTKAALVKVSGLDSEDEKIRQGVATELLEWEYGRAGVRVTSEADSELNDVRERMTVAMEKLAGVPTVIEGDMAKDITPQEEADEGE